MAPPRNSSGISNVSEAYDDVALDDADTFRPSQGQPQMTHNPLCATSVLLVPVALCLVIFGSMLGHAMQKSPMFTPLKPARRDGPLKSGAEMMRGVNLGGWLVLEPWITPSLFYQFLDSDEPAVDERTFCAKLGERESRRQLKAFRDVWVTEETFVKLRSIGINTVRLPYGYWSYGDRPEFCPGVDGIEYVDKAVRWAEKHGMRVVLDLHGVKGSQNGFDNSGDSHKPPFGRDLDAHDWLADANADIAIDVLGKMAARYANSSAVVQMGLVNEPIGFALSGFCKANCPIDQERLLAYYQKAWDAIRRNNARVTPVLDVSFRNREWAKARRSGMPWLDAGAVLDSHRYHGWWPRGSVMPQVAHLRRAGCDAHADIAAMEAEALPTVIGEWSLAVTDCMTFLNGVGLDAMMTDPAECGRVKCPTTFGALPAYATRAAAPNRTSDDVPHRVRPLPRGSHGGPDADGNCPVDPLRAPPGPLSYEAFYTQFAAYAIRGYEASRGWTFWNFKSEVADPRWGFLDMHDAGWLPKTLDGWVPPEPDCARADAAGLAWDTLLYLTLGSAVVLTAALGCALLAACSCRLLNRRSGFVKMEHRPVGAATHGAVELSSVNAPPVRSRIAASAFAGPAGGGTKESA